MSHKNKNLAMKQMKVLDAYLLRLNAGVERVPGKLKQPLGMTMRWFPCADLEPPCDIKSDKWAA